MNIAHLCHSIHKKGFYSFKKKKKVLSHCSGASKLIYLGFFHLSGQDSERLSWAGAAACSVRICLPNPKKGFRGNRWKVGLVTPTLILQMVLGG